MTTWLKQSTAVTVVLGPFVDDTDGKTAETALGLAQADIRLSKNAGTFAQKSVSGGISHMENGYYSVDLSTTDTGTLGNLVIAVSKSGALPVFRIVTIVPANTWDSLIGNTDKLESDNVQWNGTNLATPDTAGYPKVTIKDGTGTGEIDTASGRVAITEAQIDQIIDEVFAEVLEGTHTAADILRILLAVAAGKASGLDGTTVTFRNVADTKNRVSATVTTDGNRTAIGTLDGT